MAELLSDLKVLSRGTYLQLVTRIQLLDDAVIRSNEPEEVLTYFYKKESLGNRFIIPWRKVKGKVRRMAMESMRGILTDQHLKEFAEQLNQDADKAKKAYDEHKAHCSKDKKDKCEDCTSLHDAAAQRETYAQFVTGIRPDVIDCHLKSGLCMRCPCCVLFGATGDVQNIKVKANYNLLSRILGDTFISSECVDVVNSYTANAVDEKTLTTGQALMTQVKVPAETEFVGVVTLRDPTPDATEILVDALQRTTRIGGTTREWGRCKTTIEGYSLSDREEISSYELAGAVPSNLKQLTDLELPNVKNAFTSFNKMCLETLAQFDGKKKTTVKKKAAAR